MIAPHNLDLALDGLRRGLPIIPVDPYSRKPYVKFATYIDGALPTAHDIRQWWARWPNARPTLVMGPLSGMFGVDLDSQAGLDWFVENFGPLDNTYTIKSKKGWHLWYTWPLFRVGNPVIFRNPDGSAAVEIKGAGGLLPLPGTLHKSGYIYTEFNRAPIAAAPAALLDLLRPPPATLKFSVKALSQVNAEHPYIRAIVDDECAKLSVMNNGQGRYAALYSAAFKLGTLVGAGALNRSEAEAGLLSACQANGFTHDHGEKEARTHIKNGLDDGATYPRDLSHLEKLTNRPIGQPAHSPPAGDDLHPLEVIPSLDEQLAQWEALPKHTPGVDMVCAVVALPRVVPDGNKSAGLYLEADKAMITYALVAQGVADGLISDDTGIDVQTLQDLNDHFQAGLSKGFLYEGMNRVSCGCDYFFSSFAPPNSNTIQGGANVGIKSMPGGQMAHRPTTVKRALSLCEVRQKLAAGIDREILRSLRKHFGHDGLIPMLDQAELTRLLDGDETTAAELLPIIREAGKHQDEVEALKRLKAARAERHKLLTELHSNKVTDVPFPWHNASHYRAQYRRAVFESANINGEETRSNPDQQRLYGLSANGVRAMNKRAGLKGTSERAQFDLPGQDDIKAEVEHLERETGGRVVDLRFKLPGEREQVYNLLGKTFINLDHDATAARLNDKLVDYSAKATVQMPAVYRAVGPVEAPKPRKKREKTAGDTPVSQVETPERTPRQKRPRKPADFALWYFRRAAELRHGVDLSGDGLTKAECIALLRLDPAALEAEYAQVGDRLWLTHDCPELVILLWHRQRQAAERVAV